MSQEQSPSFPVENPLQNLAYRTASGIIFRMHKILLLSSLALFLTACTASTTDQMAQGDDHSDHGNDTGMTSSLNRLSDSPRHQEWVEVKRGDKTIHTFVVYPERSDDAPVVLLIHENKGLNDWARSMADQIAEAGYIAVAPDLLSGFSTERARTSDFPSDDEATKAIGQLDPQGVMLDLEAVADWVDTIDASNGEIVSAGFCWGGAQSFQFASESDDLTAAMVFYGTSPTDPAAYDTIGVPVYGFYGGADQRVNATIPAAEERMREEGNPFDYVIYDGAGHAFMRSGEDPNGDPANVAARNAAFERMKEILSGL